MRAVHLLSGLALLVDVSVAATTVAKEAINVLTNPFLYTAPIEKKLENEITKWESYEAEQREQKKEQDVESYFKERYPLAKRGAPKFFYMVHPDHANVYVKNSEAEDWSKQNFCEEAVHPASLACNEAEKEGEAQTSHCAQIFALVKECYFYIESVRQDAAREHWEDEKISELEKLYKEKMNKENKKTNPPSAKHKKSDQPDQSPGANATENVRANNPSAQPSYNFTQAAASDALPDPDSMPKHKTWGRELEIKNKKPYPALHVIKIDANQRRRPDTFSPKQLVDARLADAAIERNCILLFGEDGLDTVGWDREIQYYKEHHPWAFWRKKYEQGNLKKIRTKCSIAIRSLEQTRREREKREGRLALDDYRPRPAVRYTEWKYGGHVPGLRKRGDDDNDDAADGGLGDDSWFDPGMKKRNIESIEDTAGHHEAWWSPALSKRGDDNEDAADGGLGDDSWFDPGMQKRALNADEDEIVEPWW